jgi:hypothetical protein
MSWYALEMLVRMFQTLLRRERSLKAAPVREAHGIPSRVSIAATLLSHGGEKVRKRADMFGLGGPRFP